MLAAIKFFLGQDEKAEDSDDEDDGDRDEPKAVAPSKTDVYKATKKVSSCSRFLLLWALRI